MDWINLTNARPIGVPKAQITAFVGAAIAPPTAERVGPWRAIRNLSETETEISLYNYIGIGGITADDFVRELGEIKAHKISLRINSPGGFVDDGIAIYNAIRRHKAEVTAYVDGIAASAASFIAMAADRVVMSPHSQMMIHDAQGFAMGGPDTVAKLHEILTLYSNNIASIYADRAGGTVDEWRARMRDETWISDEHAVSMGLADSIDGREFTPEPEAEPEAEPEPETVEAVAEPEPIDYSALFERIALEAEEDMYAVADLEVD